MRQQIAHFVQRHAQVLPSAAGLVWFARHSGTERATFSEGGLNES